MTSLTVNPKGGRASSSLSKPKRYGIICTQKPSRMQGVTKVWKLDQ